jgi:hypothetical protein
MELLEAQDVPTGEWMPGEGTSNVERREFALRTSSFPPQHHSLARLFEQNGHVFVAGLNHGTRTFLNDNEIPAGRPVECHDGDHICVWPSVTIPSVIAYGGDRSSEQVTSARRPNATEDELLKFKQSIHAELLRRLRVSNASRLSFQSD